MSAGAISMSRFRVQVLFVLLALLLYGNTLTNGYALDDGFVTEHNPATKGLGTVAKIFTTHYTTGEGGNYEYRPVVTLSFALEHQLFGEHAWLSHLINVLLYAWCLWLLFKTLRGLFRNEGDVFALLCVLLFACLPVHSEVVASLKNRDVLLCFILAFLAFGQYDCYFNDGKKYRLATGTVLLLGAFLAKYDVLPCLVLFPFLLYMRYRPGLKTIALVFGVLYLSLICARLCERFLVDHSHSFRTFLYYENPLYLNNSLGLRLSTALNALGFYCKMLFYPSGMVCYYGYDTLPVHRFGSLYALLGLLCLVGLLFVFLKYRRKAFHPLWIGAAFFITSLSMFLNLVKPVAGIVADRLLFFASVGFCIVLVYLLLQAFNKRQIPPHWKQLNGSTRLVFGCIGICFTLVIVLRNREWKDRRTLYLADVKKEPGSIKLNLLAANEILDHLRNNASGPVSDAELDGASVMLLKALSIDSLNVSALNNLSYIRLNYRHDYSGAIPYLKRAYRLDSLKPQVTYNLAFSYFQTGNLALAEQFAYRAYTLRPGDAESLDLLATVIHDSKNTARGIVFFEEELRKSPNDKHLPIMLANLSIAQKDTPMARTWFEKALRSDPGNAQLIEIVKKLSK